MPSVAFSSLMHLPVQTTSAAGCTHLPPTESWSNDRLPDTGRERLRHLGEQNPKALARWIPRFTLPSLLPGLGATTLPEESASLPALSTGQRGDGSARDAAHAPGRPSTAEPHIPSPGLRAATPASPRFFRRASAPLHLLVPLPGARSYCGPSRSVTSSEALPASHHVFYPAFRSQLAMAALPPIQARDPAEPR